MTNDTNALIVGCGRIAGGYNLHAPSPVLTHAAAYRALGARVVGCCDTDLGIAKRFAEQWGIETYGDDLAGLLQNVEPDVISICTPPDARASVLEKVLAAPSVRAVLVEKPLAIGRREADQILALARAAQLPVLVNYFRAFDPFYRDLEAQCKSGALGKLCEGTVRYYGSALTNASHLLERLLAMFGSPRVPGRLSGDKESPLFELYFGDARIVFLPVAGCQYSPIEIDLLFQTRRVRVIDSERRVEWFQSKPDPAFEGYYNLSADTLAVQSAPSADSILHAVEATLNAARTGKINYDLLERAAKVDVILETVCRKP
jgi:hypothetical protein